MRDVSSKQQTKQKYKPNHQQTGLAPHSALSIRGKKKKKTQHKSHPILSLHKPLDQPEEGRSQKEDRIQTWSLGKGDLKHNKFLKSNEKAENTTQEKKQTRNTEVQINEQEIGKLPEKEFRIMIVETIKKPWKQNGEYARIS